MAWQRKIEMMRDDLQNWKSYIQFIGDEMVFIQKLLDSYIFEPRTPNLFERLENFKQLFNASKQKRASLLESIKIHGNRLGGIFECTQEESDSQYYENHLDLKANVTGYIKSYLDQKKEVYEYAGSILKKKKP
ncbi:hypothetical protein [Flagellimonas marinaquae]|uniref:hypothetical protein n=1 Tax=Flagellimonas marinaquae TaxID=254955 RepID=UPI002075E263|nr:hypothetical protein [Allomuricauda aquimarina]USD24525.1 hypothetical protein MJO53_12640 [Allomuricauda aquimarina]